MPRLTDQQIGNAAYAGGWRGNDIAIAVAVALAESGGNSEAVSPPNRNGSTDYGLWQVNSVHGYPVAQLLEVVGNARAAHEVFGRQGWTAWSVYKSGKYLVFLPRGKAVAPTSSDTGSGTGVIITDYGPLQPIVNLAKFLSDPSTYRRLGMLLLGGALLIFALFKLTGDNKLSEGTKTIAKAVVMKKVTK